MAEPEAAPSVIGRSNYIGWRVGEVAQNNGEGTEWKQPIVVLAGYPMKGKSNTATY